MTVFGGWCTTVRPLALILTAQRQSRFSSEQCGLPQESRFSLELLTCNGSIFGLFSWGEEGAAKGLHYGWRGKFVLSVALWMALHVEARELMRGKSMGKVHGKVTVSSICSSAACTDKELRNLASRLKDWFGALHEDANRVIKPTSSDGAQGSKTTSLS